MRKIELDFARTFPRVGAGRWLLLAFGLASVLVVACWDRWYWQVLARIDEDRLRVARQTEQARRPAMATIYGAQLESEWKRAISVAADLNRPWEKLFTALEAEADRQVALLSLEPDVVKGEVVLTAEAKNFAAMLDYVRELQQKDNLRNVQLHTHQVNQQDKEKPVRFRVTAKWVITS